MAKVCVGRLRRQIRGEQNGGGKMENNFALFIAR